MFKIIGAVLIIFACGRMGYFGKKALLDRRVELRALLYALQGMETEIKYGVNPLPKVLQTAGEQAGGKIGSFFYRVGKDLKSSKGETLWEIWQQNLELYQDRLCLNIDDLQILKNFGQGLGISDVGDQMRRLSLTKAELTKKIQESETSLSKMGKFWSSLGWGTGVVIVLLIF